MLAFVLIDLMGFDGSFVDSNMAHLCDTGIFSMSFVMRLNSRHSTTIEKLSTEQIRLAERVPLC